MDFLNLLKPHAKPTRNGFDLSRKHVFSSKAGILKPCLAVETVPGDSFEIDLNAITRSMTLNTAAFLRGKQRYDFFFVPYSQLWHPFNQFISQREDRHSTNQKGHLYCPVINLKDLLYWLIDIFHDPGTNLYELDIHGHYAPPQMIENMLLLGYGDFRWVLGSATKADKQTYADQYAYKYVNVFRLAAFQHIWYDFYRNKYYDVDSTGGIDTLQGNMFSNVDMFNFDDIDCSSFGYAQIPVGNALASDSKSYRLMRLLQPRYIQYKKDLFTSALPGQQFGAVSSVNMYSDIINTSSDTSRWKAYDGSSLSGGSVFADASNSLYESSVGIINHDHSIPSIAQSFDVLQLRKAEMLQVWKQRTLRAGNMVDDNFEAHFGTKPYYEEENNVNYLGSFSAALDINSVEATAASTQPVNGKVGDLAATGIATVSGNKIKFSPRDFGVIMCCASFLPESEYNAVGIDKANTLYSEFDFFTPEFENIGLEAIPYRELDFRYGDVAHSESPVGFAPRYWMYKEARDKVFGEFQDQGMSTMSSLKPWVAPRHVYVNFDSSGAYQQDRSNLYVKPDILNNIFAITASGYSSSDCFLNNVYFDIKAIRPMSELGLPQF